MLWSASGVSTLCGDVQRVEACEACQHLELVLVANVFTPLSYWPIPFITDHRPTFTFAAKFYVTTLMRSVIESETFARWTAAGTFEKLRAYLAQGAFPSPGRLPVFEGCRACGTFGANSFGCFVCEAELAP